MNNAETKQLIELLNEAVEIFSKLPSEQVNASLVDGLQSFAYKVADAQQVVENIDFPMTTSPKTAFLRSIAALRRAKSVPPTHPHAQIICSLERAEKMLRAESNRLCDQMNYDAQFFEVDADSMLEAIELLKVEND